MTSLNRVLIMDDEEMVREVLGEMLKILGYEVEFALDGKEAIAKFLEAKQKGCPFALVIMDLTVPGGMGGKEAIGELRKIDPKIKAIVSSGYSKDDVLLQYKDYGFDAALVKPYRLEELKQVIEQVTQSIKR